MQLPEGDEVAVRPGNLELVYRSSSTTASSAVSAEQRLLEAACAGSLDEVVRLLEHGARIDATDGNGCTATMWAAWKGHAEVLGELIEW